MAQPIKWTEVIVPNGGVDETQSPQKIPENKWVSGENVEPLVVGARRRRGMAASNSIPLQTISLSATGGTDDRELAAATSVYVAQGFTVGASAISVQRIAVRLKTLTGSPTGEIRAAIYSNSGGVPGSAVTGAGLGNFSTMLAESTTTSYKWYQFTLASPVSLVAATVYHVVIRHNTAAATGTNNISIEEDTAGNPYSGGAVSISPIAVSWTAVAAADINFRVYAGTAAITAIADYRLSDGSASRHLVFAGGELYKNQSGVLTPVSAPEAAAMTANAQTLPSWAVGSDRLFLTNNVEVSKKFYILGGTEYWENEGIAAPTATPTVAAAAGGTLPDGDYEVDYYYWNNDLGISSDRRYNGVSASAVTLGTGNNTISISNLPADVARTGDRATHIRIEVKLDGASVFRYAAEVALGVTVSTIASDTTTVLAEYEHAVAPVHKIKLIAENRQFILNVAGAPYRLMGSAIVGTTPYYESFPVNNKRDFGKGDGDYGTALAFIPPRTLIVGFKNSIYAVDARRPFTSDVATIAKNIGIAGHKSLLVVGRKMFFVSDAAENKGMFVWTGSGEPQPVLGVDDTFKGYDQSRLALASCAHLAPGDNRYQWWTLLTSSGTSHDRILVYDYLLGSWAVYTKDGKELAVLGTIETSGVSAIYGGGYNGIEYVQDSGSTDAGTAYEGKFTGKVFDFGAENLVKKMRWVDYLVATQTSGSLNLTVNRDYGNRSALTTNLQQMTTGTPFTLGTSVLGGTAVLGGGSQSLQRVRLRGAGRVFQPVFAGSSPWELQGVVFGVQPTRRM